MEYLVWIKVKPVNNHIQMLFITHQSEGYCHKSISLFSHIALLQAYYLPTIFIFCQQTEQIQAWWHSIPMMCLRRVKCVWVFHIASRQNTSHFLQAGNILLAVPCTSPVCGNVCKWILYTIGKHCHCDVIREIINERTDSF